MRIAARGLASVLLLAAGFAGRASAETDESAANAIRTALENWRVDFNARKADRICDLFAPDLRYDFQGLSEQTYPQLCARLNRALADRSKTLHYDLRIKEVLVSAPLAIVRLTWVSTVTEGDGRRATDDEQGLDVFRRDADGAWRIIRYIAYPEHP